MKHRLEKLKELIFSQRGFGVYSVLAIALIAMALAFGVAFVVETEGLLSSRSRKSNRAFHVAEAGAEQYIWWLNHGGLSEDQHPGIGEGNWQEIKEDEKTIGWYYIEIDQLPAASDDRRTLTFEVTATTENPEENPNPSLTRTIRQQAKKPTFLDVLWFTDTEQDEYQNRVYWTSDDRLDGPFFTNKDIYVWGNPTFNGKVRFVGSVYQRGRSDPLNNDELGSLFSNGWEQLPEALEFPPSNQDLIQYAEPKYYYYSLDTKGERTYNADTTITLWHQDNEVQILCSKNNNPDAETGTITLPSSDVVMYVEGNVHIKTKNHDPTQDKLDARLTIAATGDIYIWDDIVYADTDLDPSDGSCSDDVLGLIANEHVYIGNEKDPPRGDWLPAGTDRTVYAAIMALDSFGLQNYQNSDTEVLGTLTVKGSIIQRYRGAVAYFDSNGTRTQGFVKNYLYDERLRFADYEPPEFLNPTNYYYIRTSWEES